MQIEIVMERRPVIVYYGRRYPYVRDGLLLGWFQRSGFFGNNWKPVGLVEFADGTIGEFEASEVRYADC